jgi:hypothetical protein
MNICLEARPQWLASNWKASRKSDQTSKRKSWQKKTNKQVSESEDEDNGQHGSDIESINMSLGD